MSAAVREQLGRKPAVAAFIARVSTAAVELQVNWLCLTNVAPNPVRIEATFAITPTDEE